MRDTAVVTVVRTANKRRDAELNAHIPDSSRPSRISDMVFPQRTDDRHHILTGSALNGRRFRLSTLDGCRFRQTAIVPSATVSVGSSAARAPPKFVYEREATLSEYKGETPQRSPRFAPPTSAGIYTAFISFAR